MDHVYQKCMARLNSRLICNEIRRLSVCFQNEWHGERLWQTAALFSTVTSGAETIQKRVMSELLPQGQQAIRLLIQISAAAPSGTKAAGQTNAKM